MRKLLRGERRFDDMLALCENGRNVCYCAPSPPAPDPAVGQAASANAEVAREQLAFSKQIYEEGKPRTAAYDAIVNKVVDQQLAAADKNTALADDYNKYLKETFWPLEKGIVNDAQNYDTAARREEMAGEAVGDVRTQFGLQRDVARRNLSRNGVNPNQLADMELQTGIAEAGASAGAANTARRNVENMGLARRMDAASLGRNLPSNQATSQNIALNAGNAAAGNAAGPVNQPRADAALMNQGFGNAVGANTAAGNLLLGQYNAQVGAANAANAGMAGIGNLVGTLGSAALMAPVGTFKDGGLVRRKKSANVSVYADGGQIIEGEASRIEDGGEVQGPGTTTSDSVPAQTAEGDQLRVSNGEFVLNADAVDMVGLPVLESINQAGLQRRKILEIIGDEADGFPPEKPMPPPKQAIAQVRAMANGGGLRRSMKGGY